MRIITKIPLTFALETTIFLEKDNGEQETLAISQIVNLDRDLPYYANLYKANEIYIIGNKEYAEAIQCDVQYELINRYSNNNIKIIIQGE